jgi:PPP family 3-phenylpropionic acid transporter
MFRFNDIRTAFRPKIRGGAFYLSFFLSTGSFSPFLNVYYRELGFSGQQIGTLSVVFPLMSLIFATPIAAMADRKQWRIKILQVGIVIGAVFISLLGFPDTYLMMALPLGLIAIAFSPVMSIADSLIVNMASRNDLNYGNMRLWGSVGFAASAMIFGMVWQRFQFTLMFLTGSLLMVPLFLIASTLDEVKTQDYGERQSIAGIFKDSGLVILILVSFLMGISNAMSMAFEGIYVTTLGGGNMQVGMVVGVAAVGEILTMHKSRAIASRLLNANTLILSLVMMGIANIGYVLVGNPWVMIPLAAIKGLGFGLFFTNIVRIVNERAPKEWVTTTQSLRAIAMFSVAQLVAGPLGGLVLDRISPSFIFVIGAAALGMAALVVGIAKQRKILG